MTEDETMTLRIMEQAICDLCLANGGSVTIPFSDGLPQNAILHRSYGADSVTFTLHSDMRVQ